MQLEDQTCGSGAPWCRPDTDMELPGTSWASAALRAHEQWTSCSQDDSSRKARMWDTTSEGPATSWPNLPAPGRLCVRPPIHPHICKTGAVRDEVFSKGWLFLRTECPPASQVGP